MTTYIAAVSFNVMDRSKKAIASVHESDASPAPMKQIGPVCDDIVSYRGVYPTKREAMQAVVFAVQDWCGIRWSDGVSFSEMMAL